MLNKVGQEFVGLSPTLNRIFDMGLNNR